MNDLERRSSGPPTPGHQVADVPELMRAVRARTPARVLVGRAGPAYHTTTQLELRQDHAAAVDAVHAELDLNRDFGSNFLNQWDLFEVRTQAASKSEYLLRPDLGRRLSEEAKALVAQQCPRGPDFQFVIGDGLSATAVKVQVPLLPLLMQGAKALGSVGRPFVIRYCRVGVLNDVGEVLQPVVAVLLVGERPGLATAESLSAYVAYRPRPGHTDAQRNLISNIHARGVSPEEESQRILALADKMKLHQASGVSIKEDLRR